MIGGLCSCLGGKAEVFYDFDEGGSRRINTVETRFDFLGLRSAGRGGRLLYI